MRKMNTVSLSVGASGNASGAGENRPVTSSTTKTRVSDEGEGPSTFGTMQRRDLQKEMLKMILTSVDAERPVTVDRLLTLCEDRDNCVAFVQAGVLPFVVALIHDQKCSVSTSTRDVREKAGKILHNLIHSQTEDKAGRRYQAILRSLEDVRLYSYMLIRGESVYHAHGEEEEDGDAFPVRALLRLTSFSFDEEKRATLNQLGGLQAVCELLQCDISRFDNSVSRYHVAIRHQSCQFLINLTCGDGINKQMLCSSTTMLECLVRLLSATSEELRMVSAGVLRNVSWRADVHSRLNLRDSKAVISLMRAAMQAKNEDTIKIMTYALYNLSAQSEANKLDICAYDGALAFLVHLLSYRSASKTTSVAENAGGILHNLAGVISHRPEILKVLRENSLLDILVGHLRSSCLAWVSNACNIIWTLSSRSTEDQQRLWDLGAVELLRDLMSNRHKAIAQASAKAYRHLSSCRPGAGLAQSGERIAPGGEEIWEQNSGSKESKNPRKNTSVPNSPQISSRTDRFVSSNRSMRSNGGSERIFHRSFDDRRDRTVQIVADVSRQINQSNPAFDAILAKFGRDRSNEGLRKPVSPPLIPNTSRKNQKPHTTPEKPSYRTNHGSEEPAAHIGRYGEIGDERNYNDHAENSSSRNPFDELTDDRDVLVPGAQHHPAHLRNWQTHVDKTDLNLQDLGGEDEETRDEFVNFGRKCQDVRCQLVCLHIKKTVVTTAVLNGGSVNDYGTEDTVRRFSTERTPQFSTATSMNDLRANTASRKDDSQSRASRPFAGFSPARPAPVKRLLSSSADSRHSYAPTAMQSMLASRGSSPGDLSEPEANLEELDEAAQSEYSCDVSGMISPSDVPASPSLMPSTPRTIAVKRRLLPVPPVQVAVRPIEMEKKIEELGKDMVQEDLRMFAECIKSGHTVEKDEGFEDKKTGKQFEKPSPTGVVADLSALILPGAPFETDPAGAGLQEMPADNVPRTFRTEVLSSATSLSSLTMSDMSKPAAKPLQSAVPALDLAASFKHFMAGIKEKAGNVIMGSIAAENGSPSAAEQMALTPPMEKGFIGSALGNSAEDLDLLKSYACIQLQKNNDTVVVKPIELSAEETNNISSSCETLTRDAPVDLPENSVQPSSQDEVPPLTPEELAALEAKLKPLDEKEHLLLTDCIYAALPSFGKHRHSKKPSSRPPSARSSGKGSPGQTGTNGSAAGTEAGVAGEKAEPNDRRVHHRHKKPSKVSARKMQIHDSLKTITGVGMPKSQSAGLSGSLCTPVEMITRSKSSGQVESGFLPVPEEEPVVPQPHLSREHLTLQLLAGTQLCSAPIKTIPCAANGRSQGAPTPPPPLYLTPAENAQMGLSEPDSALSSDPWIHKSSPSKPDPDNGVSGILEASLTSPGPFSEADFDVHDETAGTKDSARSQSPDVFEMLDKKDPDASSLASRFTSEEEGDQEATHEVAGRPRIIKPVRSSVGQNHGQNGGSHKVVRNGHVGRSNRIKPPPAGVRPASIRGGGQVIHHEQLMDNHKTGDGRKELTDIPARIVKQGTFTRDRSTAVVPIILPESSSSRESPRKRYGSVTRSPREGSSRMGSGESISGLDSRHKAGSPQKGSGKQTAAVPKASPLVPGDGNTSKPTKKESVPVTSKIAALWRGDGNGKNKKKSQSQDEPRGIENGAGLKKSSTDVTGMHPSGLKSPTLSEKMGVKRKGFFGRMGSSNTATLPKMSHQSAVVSPFNYTFLPNVPVPFNGEISSAPTDTNNVKPRFKMSSNDAQDQSGTDGALAVTSV